MIYENSHALVIILRSVWSEKLVIYNFWQKGVKCIVVLAIPTLCTVEA